jgi:hypothetical protein
MKNILTGEASGWIFVVLFIFMGVCQYFSMAMIPTADPEEKGTSRSRKHHTKPEKPSKTEPDDAVLHDGHGHGIRSDAGHLQCPYTGQSILL